ncbi:DUF2185 domain-containing protein [Chitinophaga horti]|uniref:DUF2185 domain-containing protein n=1 Tax=Chitinophaga horti TaxID=2920382 RepID=A0ABY6J395_9BACT|nr:DUF2185 domain-containing protein [Chitinophaga horti]UYQ92664.1 DUF2185 domain-containing protein [Chitinophaga horti]
MTPALLVSKMILDEKIEPRFMYREKRTRPEDTGWRVFCGLEGEDEAEPVICTPEALIAIDPSVEDILHKGVGSVWEKDEHNEWLQVLDFDMEDDYMATHQLTKDWTIDINNLFERRVEESGDLLYTTGDKSVRLTIWRADNNKEALVQEYQGQIDNRDQSKSKTVQTFDQSDEQVARIGYIIEEEEGDKKYSVLYGFCIIDKEVVLAAIYFDYDGDLDWALETWKSIKTVQFTA